MNGLREVLAWIQHESVTVAGHPLPWIEIFGNVFGFASAILGMRRKVWAWPIGIIGNVLLFTVFFGVAFSTPQHETLYGQAGRQVFFIITSVYGWWRWNQVRRLNAHGADAPAIIVSATTCCLLCHAAPVRRNGHASKRPPASTAPRAGGSGALQRKPAMLAL